MHTPQQHLGRVSLVGAGPGDPRLLTLRAQQCLSTADVIVYDQLLSAELLDHAPHSARRLAVKSFHPHHAERSPLVIQALIDGARQGLHVVRLKGGDPFLFGRGGEECEALRQAGVPYEVVPGISAAFGAGAYCGIPLTHRDHASCVTFVTGHEHPEKGEPAVDWESLARLNGTLAVFMGLARLDILADRLIKAGRPATTPAAAVQWATTGQQRTIVGTLANLAERVKAAQLGTPTLLLIGEVVGLRERLAWFESRPLFGQRILICRPRGQAESMAELLLEQGAVPLLLPTVEVRSPQDWEPVDAAIRSLGTYQWLVFTSANGVRAFFERLFALGLDLRALATLKLAVIGPATGKALWDYHLKPDAQPASFRSEDLVSTLLPQVQGQRVLLARADRGRDILRDELGQVAQVDQVAVYSQVDSVDVTSPAFESLLRGEVDWITVTSSNIARSLHRTLQNAGYKDYSDLKSRVATISPVTSAAVREVGWTVTVEAQEYTIPGIIQALIRWVSENQSPVETPSTKIS